MKISGYNKLLKVNYTIMNHLVTENKPLTGLNTSKRMRQTVGPSHSKKPLFPDSWFPGSLEDPGSRKGAWLRTSTTARTPHGSLLAPEVLSVLDLCNEKIPGKSSLA